MADRSYRPNTYASVASGPQIARGHDDESSYEARAEAAYAVSVASGEASRPGRERAVAHGEFIPIEDFIADLYPPSIQTTHVERSERHMSDQNDKGRPRGLEVSYVPSYLRNSRYIERLRTTRRDPRHYDKTSDKTRRRFSDTVGVGARNPRSTLSDIFRRDAEARTKPWPDIVEKSSGTDRAPDDELEELDPLPSRWNERNKFPALKISTDGTEVLLKDEVKSADDAAAVKTNYHIPKECGLYYYEVTVLSKGMVGIGLSGTRPSVSRLPGWEQDSWGYHGDDGLLYSCSSNAGKAYGPSFTEGDVVGCGFDFRMRSIFFTKNGVWLGFPQSDSGPSIHTVSDRLYPTVGMKKKHDNVKANFGQSPFVFDIDTMMEHSKGQVANDVTASLTTKNPAYVAQRETEEIQRLVAQYLAHEGFVDTAAEFTNDIRDQRRNLLPEASWPAMYSSIDDDTAPKRQRIRAAILEGDIDHALAIIDEFYPKVLQMEENRHVYFKLKCRKFTEMVYRIHQQQMKQRNGASDDGSSLYHQGPKDGPEPEDADRIAELKRLNGKSSVSLNAMDVDQDTVAPQPMIDNAHVLDTLAVIEYGKTLSEEFENDSRPEVKRMLDLTFAPIAHLNATDATLEELGDSKDRAELAEQINGAILVSQGKPRDAVLSTYCGQTQAMLDMLASAKGGPATMINVRKDLLQEPKWSHTSY